MPTTRFGQSNVEPIYNVTGRNPRDIGRQGASSLLGSVPNAGVSKNFAADPEYQPKQGYFGANLVGWNPLNPLSRFGQRMAWGSFGRSGKGDNSSQENGNNGNEGGRGGVTVVFGDQSGHKAFADSGNVTVSGTINADNADLRGAFQGGNPFQQHNQQITQNQPQAANQPQATKTPRVRKPLTDEQRARKNEGQRARRASAKTQTPGNKPSGKAPRTPSKPARTPSQPVKVSQTINAAPSVDQSNSPVTNKARVMGNF
jgi:hypothetical protein